MFVISEHDVTARWQNILLNFGLQQGNQLTARVELRYWVILRARRSHYAHALFDRDMKSRATPLSRLSSNVSRRQVIFHGPVL